MKPYKLTMYWVNTKKFCGAITVDEKGIICDPSASCYKWMTGKKFSRMLNMLKYKKYLIGCKKLD